MLHEVLAKLVALPGGHVVRRLHRPCVVTLSTAHTHTNTRIMGSRGVQSGCRGVIGETTPAVGVELLTHMYIIITIIISGGERYFKVCGAVA